MKENVFKNPVELRPTVPAPHFEDRRVVMRAQRVVPLDVIRTQLRRRRLLFLGCAFAIALVLGAASALVAVQIKRLAAPSQISQIEEPDVTTAAAAEPAAAAPSPQVDSAAEPASVEEEETPVEEPAQPVAPKRRDSVAERPRVVTPDRDDRAVQPSEEEQLEQIRDAVLYERWQERRARRVARRERRNGGDDRDLSRVDEIFEGRRRRTDRPY